ncbi:MAG: molybdopterin oxidoreductase membrane [Planctomycetota bacterium]|nr:MAG: molybdopterin oxidoreductase membrane [Planctomycetota bacterium]
MKSLGYVLLTALSAAGLWAIGVRFSEGLAATHLTQHVPWGLWISLYIYFIGLSAGSFLLSTLIYVFGVRRFEPVGPLALLQALGCMMIGLFLIWVDLGKPSRFFNVFFYFNASSVLAWESVLYVLYTAIILAELFLLLRPALARRARDGVRPAWLYRTLAFGTNVPDEAWIARARRRVFALGLLGIPVAIGVHGGTGAIFAVVKSRPTWHTGLFPIVFLVSALASGGALLTFLTAATSSLPQDRKIDIVKGLARFTVGILALDLLLLVSEMLVVFYGGMPAHIAGWQQILFGPFWWVFWGVQLVLGAAVPLVLVAAPRTRSSVRWLGLAGALVVIGVVGVRLNVVVPAQIPLEFAGLPDAYHHTRFAPGYFPSLNEWLVGLGTVALFVWPFLLSRKVLPLEEAV